MESARISSSVGGVKCSGSDSSRKIHGFPSAARPMATSSHPAARYRLASARVSISPFPTKTTGFSRVFKVCAVDSACAGSADGIYICSRVRQWSVIFAAPARAISAANSAQLICPVSQPARILTDSGTPYFAHTSATAAVTSRAMSGVRIRAEPSPEVTIFFTGQPMLMSIPAGGAA